MKSASSSNKLLAMDRWKRDALISLERDLKLNLSLTDLVSRLERPAGGFMTDTDRVSVEAKEGRINRVGRIIEILRKRGNEDYDIFLKILRLSGNEVWASAIEEEAEQFKKEYDNQEVSPPQRKRSHGEPSIPPAKRKPMATSTTTGRKIMTLPSLPIERQVISSVLHENEVYVTGIATDDVPESREVYAYSLDETKWSTVPEAPNLKPAPNCNAPMAVINDRITLIGGRDAETKRITNTMSTWVEDEREWKQLLPLMPTNRLATGVCHHDNLLLVTGGVEESTEKEKKVVSTVHVYNISTGRWSTPKALELPKPLRSHHLAVFDENIYLAAGAFTFPAQAEAEKHFNPHAWRARWSNVLEAIEWDARNDAATDQQPSQQMESVWTPITAPPFLRTTVISSQTSLFAVGGLKDGLPQSAIYKFVDEKIDNSWIQVGDMSVGRYRNGVVPLGNLDAVLMVVGGMVQGKPAEDEINVKTSSVELVIL